MYSHIPPDDGGLRGWQDVTTPSARLEFAVLFRPENLDDAVKRVVREDRAYSRESFVEAHGIPQAVDRTRRWLEASGLRVTGSDDFAIWAEGTFATVGRALGVEFEEVVQRGRRYFRPRREPTLPAEIAAHVVAVVGLDNLGRLYPKHRISQHREQLANNGEGFFPQDIRAAYRIPSGLDGSGITIGLLEFSNGYAESDLTSFWSAFQIPSPTVAFVSVDGTPNDGGASSVDMECTLDLEWAGAIAPGARLAVYEADAGSSDRSFGLSVLRALRCALNDTVNQPTVVSISYGDGETRFSQATMAAWDSTMAEMNARGITVFVASGDQGAYGLHGIGRPIPHVDAPANCMHAVAVGGTHLITSGGRIAEETGWTDTNDSGASGGGLSQVFAVPSYQEKIALPVSSTIGPGRGVPDVALNADPDTGYAVVFQGSGTVVGGTSASSPIWAAITALINQARSAAGKSALGAIHQRLYDLGEAPVFHDITVGNNSYAGVSGYQCVPGWDAVTGLGSVDAAELLAALG